jgi:hypothetical protein
MTDQETAEDRVDRLIDAIDLLKEDRRKEAIHILRGLIREDNDFEDAWLWMSVAVDSLDQSSICLENVLRINRDNAEAASALFRLRGPEMLLEKQRNRIRLWRDLSIALMWLLVLMLLYAMLFAFLTG